MASWKCQSFAFRRNLKLKVGLFESVNTYSYEAIKLTGTSEGLTSKYCSESNRTSMYIVGLVSLYYYQYAGPYLPG